MPLPPSIAPNPFQISGRSFQPHPPLAATAFSKKSAVLREGTRGLVLLQSCPICSKVTANPGLIRFERSENAECPGVQKWPGTLNPFGSQGNTKMSEICEEAAPGFPYNISISYIFYHNCFPQFFLLITSMLGAGTGIFRSWLVEKTSHTHTHKAWMISSDSPANL